MDSSVVLMESSISDMAVYPVLKIPMAFKGFWSILFFKFSIIQPMDAIN